MGRRFPTQTTALLSLKGMKGWVKCCESVGLCWRSEGVIGGCGGSGGGHVRGLSLLRNPLRILLLRSCIFTSLKSQTFQQ